MQVFMYIFCVVQILVALVDDEFPKRREHVDGPVTTRQHFEGGLGIWNEILGLLSSKEPAGVEINIGYRNVATPVFGTDVIDF